MILLDWNGYPERTLTRCKRKDKSGQQWMFTIADGSGYEFGERFNYEERGAGLEIRPRLYQRKLRGGEPPDGGTG